MIVLDTNVISEFSRPVPHENVKSWMLDQKRDSLYLCVITIMEQAYGAERFLQRTGSDRYAAVLKNLLDIQFVGRILGFDSQTALRTASLRARRDGQGHPISIQDAMIAAICLSSGATLATRNTKDFEGLDLGLINPFEDG